MIRIIGIPGSLRKQSFNTALLRAAATFVPTGTSLEMRSIADIPLYNGDVEKESGVPGAVKTLQDEIAQSDALLIATPEYNNGIPGVLKNAFDWLSRPPKEIPRVFGGKPAALMGATPGGFGTVLSQNAWLPVLRTLGMELWPAKMMVPRAGSVFDEEGNLVDDAIRERLQKFMNGFAEHLGNAKE